MNTASSDTHLDSSDPADMHGEFAKTLRALQEEINHSLNGKEQVRVLEAGCGSATHVDLGGNAVMVGIDISREQLNRNSSVNEAIVGDIQSYELPPSSFDVILCWDVLEHVKQPRLAMNHFTDALKPSGIMILAMPNVHSFEGLITKYTPHRFHVWVLRHIFGDKMAGVDGRGPFATFLKTDISPGRIEAYAKEKGLVMLFFSVYSRGRVQEVRRKFGVLGQSVYGIAKAMQALTGGRIQSEKSSLVVMMQRPQ